MNNPNPLIPQGSLESHNYKQRSVVKTVVLSILVVHTVVLGGLLFLGCQEEPSDAESQLAMNDDTGLDFGSDTNLNQDPFADLIPMEDTVEQLELPMPRTNAMPPMPGTNQDRGFLVDETADPAPRTVTPNPYTNSFPVEPAPAETGGSASEPRYSSYTVQPGDTFTGIAQDHGLKLQDVVAANPGVDARRLQVGQKINLPNDVTPATPDVPVAPDAASSLGMQIYTVKSGDNLTRIARDFGTTVKAIQRANGLRGSLIRVGQKLVIPPPDAAE